MTLSLVVLSASRLVCNSEIFASKAWREAVAVWAPRRRERRSTGCATLLRCNSTSTRAHDRSSFKLGSTKTLLPAQNGQGLLEGLKSSDNANHNIKRVPRATHTQTETRTWFFNLRFVCGSERRWQVPVSGPIPEGPWHEIITGGNQFNHCNEHGTSLDIRSACTSSLR